MTCYMVRCSRLTKRCDDNPQVGLQRKTETLYWFFSSSPIQNEHHITSTINRSILVRLIMHRSWAEDTAAAGARAL
jgi:hypothetical protein